jgi:GT2 family glycosyltransferase
MKSSVIIPTCNRPRELKRCLKSILEQTHLPDEIIVIDDGGLKDMPYRTDFEQRDVQCFLKKKAQKGLTRSRNLGIKMASGDIVMFLDDDVVLTTTYIHEIVNVYESGFDKELGGVGGVDLNYKNPGLLNLVEYIYNIIFLISPIHPGNVTMTGFSEQTLTAKAHPFKKIIKARVLSGGISSFHKKVFEQFLFSEDFINDNHCQGEDKDFTIRVSKVYHLYIQPKAQLYHFPCSIGRPSKYRRGREIILSAYRIFSRYVRHGNYSVWLFYYSFSGYFFKFFIRFLLTMKKDELERIKGFLDAFQVIRKNEII